MKSEQKELSPTSQTTSTPKLPSFWKQTWENVQVIGIALLLALLIRVFIAEPRYIPSDSMFPTLEVGDRLVVEKVSYYFHSPNPGDIVVFQPPKQLQIQGYDKDQAFIKRVIGKPGDTVSIHDRTVYINNVPLKEGYIYQPPRYDLEAVQVPDGKLFVMGDNRNNSNDSHIWGFLPQQNVIGRAIFRFWPLNRLGGV
ncbi:MAG: signal peptidase I [Chroococcales cyanobacterium]